MLPIQFIPFASFILAISLFFRQKTLSDFIGPENIQFILIFSVTLFVYSILGWVLTLIDPLLFFIIWCIILIILIGFMIYVFRRLGQEKQNNKDDNE